MYSLIFHISVASIFASTTRAYFVDFDFKKPVHKPVAVDVNSLKHAAEVISFLKKINSQKPHQRNEGFNTLQGIDLDYLGITDPRYSDNQLLTLIKKNYFSDEDNGFLRIQSEPRTYIITNPAVIEEYRQAVQKRKESPSKEDRDTDVQKFNLNMLMLINHLIRRDGASVKDNDDATDANEKSENRNENLGNADEYKSQAIVDNFDGDIGGTVKLDDADPLSSHIASKEVSKTIKDDSVEKTVKFKSHYDYDNKEEQFKVTKSPWDYNKNDRTEKANTKFNFNIPVKKPRDDEDIKKSIENFKNSWAKKRESIRDREVTKKKRWDRDSDERDKRNKPKRNDDYNNMKYKPEMPDRSRGNIGSNNRGYSSPSYHPYGRTPVPFIGKKSVFEDEE